MEIENPEEKNKEVAMGLQISDLQDVQGFFAACGLETVPLAPRTNREITELLQEPDPWNCSLQERQRLHAYWTMQVKENMERKETAEFEKLRRQHADALAAFQEGRDEVCAGMILGSGT
jgi:hypothetical protein